MDSAPIRPFDPERPRKGLFNFRPDTDGALPLLTIRDLQEIRRGEGLSGEQLTAFWAEHFNKGKLNLDELYPFIVAAAWRIARGLSMLKGKLGPETFLNEMEPCEWSTPSLGSNAGASGRSIERALMVTSVAILPPEPPAEWLNGEKDPNFYDPASDIGYSQHLELIMRVATRLGIEQRREGRYGLLPLTDPAIARSAWPTPREIMAFESVMVDESVQVLISDGHFGALRKLRELHGLTHEEAGSMILLARRAMRSMRNGTDSDGDKATMIARLEDLAMRCRTSLDLRAELMVYKTLAVVQGITKTQATDEDVDDMVNVAGEVIAGELAEGEDDDGDEE